MSIVNEGITNVFVESLSMHTSFTLNVIVLRTQIRRINAISIENISNISQPTKMSHGKISTLVLLMENTRRNQRTSKIRFNKTLLIVYSNVEIPSDC